MRNIVIYTGIEVEGLTHGGEYEVVNTITWYDRVLRVVVIGDDGKEHRVSPSEVAEV